MTFGLTELMLDLNYVLQSQLKVDLESMQIVLCVNEATMRPLMLDPTMPADVLSAEKPANEFRGSISRRNIADKTGISRETVRRKVAELAALGLVQIDDADRVRASQLLGDPTFQRSIERAHQAVRRYLEGLEGRQIDWRSPV